MDNLIINEIESQDIKTPVVSNETINSNKMENICTQTYLSINDKNTEGNLEIDLKQSREKNILKKYLSINLSFTVNNETVSLPFMIDNEEDFNIIKDFFTKLNWNS